MPWTIRALQLISTLSLAIWTGVLVMTGAAAGFTFATLKGLSPVISGYAVPPAEQWQLVGGMVANRFFVAADVVGYICCGLAVVSLALLFSLRRLMGIGRLHLITRVLTVAVVLMIFSYQLFVLGPRMAENLSVYWDAAAKGDQQVMATRKAAFDADHPVASKVLSALAVATLLAAGASAWPSQREGTL